MSKERLYLYDTTLRCPFARRRASAEDEQNEGVRRARRVRDYE